MDHQNIEKALEQLQSLQQTPLSIIRISDPLKDQANSHTRSSDTILTLNPQSAATLAADLAHYKELFSKLRFSYIEQVTKEKFLRGIVGDPPQIVDARENAEVERELVDIKAALKEEKEAVDRQLIEIEQVGRTLAQRWEIVSLQSARLREIPDQIVDLDAQLELARQAALHGEEDEEGHLAVGESARLGLPASKALLAQRTAELEEVEQQLKRLQQAVPRQESTLERERMELVKLQTERDRAVSAATEAVRRKEAAGGVDAVELRGRWCAAVHDSIQGILDVKT